MKQAYHSNAVTNIHVRSEINGSNLKNFELAEKYNVSKPTVSKWKNRESYEDKPVVENFFFGLKNMQNL